MGGEGGVGAVVVRGAVEYKCAEGERRRRGAVIEVDGRA